VYHVRRQCEVLTYYWSGQPALQIDRGEGCFNIETLEYSASSGEGPVVRIKNTGVNPSSSELFFIASILLVCS
jgi:hypothetical protein